MLRVTYLSRETAPFTSRALIDLLEQCRRNNPRWDVTGLLIYGNGTFLQTIEGAQATVDALLERIAKDPRHCDFRILRREEVAGRRHADWSMGFERMTDEKLREIPGMRDLSLREFNADFLSTHSGVVEDLLHQHRSRHWDPLIGEIDARDRLIESLRSALMASEQRIEMVALLIESVIESGRGQALDETHLALCRSTLAALRAKQGTAPASKGSAAA